MIKNYFLTALRNLSKNRIYSIINITGLAVGIASSILILLWVKNELTFDQFIPKVNRLAQVWINADFDNKVNSWRSVPLPTYEAMKTTDAHIVNSCVADWGGQHLLTVGDKKIMKKGYYVGGEFLTMFEFPMVSGDPKTVLDDASSIVITEKTAREYFGDEDPINKIIRVDDKSDLKVTGVIKDIPENSTFQFDCLLPYKYWRSVNPWVIQNESNWGNYSFQVFVELSDRKYISDAEKNIAPMISKHDDSDFTKKFFLYPMDRWGLYSNFDNGVEKGGMIDFVKLFSVIAVFILLIACINFMNLSTARSSGRAREVGIRKAMGSRKVNLVLQFITESMLITLSAFLIAILLTLAFLPLYNNLVQKHLSIDFTSSQFWIFSLGIILFTGIVSGSYPAFYLSSFQPVRVLKGKIMEGKRASLPRKVLVIIQFGFSILLIAGTIVIFRQINVARDRELGYKQNNLIQVIQNDELRNNYDVLKNELLRTGYVDGVTVSNSPVTQINSNNFLGWPGKPDDQRVIFTTITTEYDYCNTMGIKILMGRDFSRDFKSDSSAILINKAALDLMKLKDPIGTQLELWDQKRTLIGVVDNVLMGSPYQEISPMFIVMDNWPGYISIRISNGRNLQEALDQIKSVFEKFNSAYPFDYEFADQEFGKKFENIKLTSSLVNLFATLAIIITGLGLLGLASYMAEQRTKEIGIRKVMGASVFNIVYLMSTDFAILVILSFVISSPISWWLLKNYLKQYPIHTDLTVWIFLFTGFVVFLFALIIVGTQSMRAAQTDPVRTLRDE